MYSSDRGLIVLRQQLMKWELHLKPYQMVDGSGIGSIGLGECRDFGSGIASDGGQFYVSKFPLTNRRPKR
jgi:hypothetical protein